MSDDRADHHELMLTHETLSSFLGVRRESVSVAAGRLQKTGLIAYRRDCLLILDRPGLEALSCQCYREIKARDDALAEPDPGAPVAIDRSA